MFVCVCLSVRAFVRACLVAVRFHRPLPWNDCDVVATVVTLPRLKKQNQERRQTAVDVFFLLLDANGR